MNTWTILQGSCIDTLPTLLAESAQCCVTSPPYWGLRDYGHPGQLGLEKTPQEYVENMVRVFREVRRVLRNDGVLWLNLGDSYAAASNGPQGAENEDRWGKGRLSHKRKCEFSGRRVKSLGGLKPKDLVGIPWRVAFALQQDGWWLRSDCIWSKPNPMPESVTDRPTKAHEYVFMLSKSERYYFGQDEVREANDPANVDHHDRYCSRPNASSRGPNKDRNDGGGTHQGGVGYNPLGRNIRTVWQIATEPCKEAHFAVMPRALARRCILAGCPVGGTVLDPFGGAGTVAVEATALGRNAVICELNPAYVEIARRRVAAEVPLLAREVVA
jgi:DNA modification methylase